MKRFSYFLITATTIFGCATSPKYQLVKNAPPQQISQDNAYCRSQADLIQTPEWVYRGTFMEGASIVSRQNAAFENCLLSKGYSKQSATQREADQSYSDKLGYIKERIAEICTKHEYAPIFEKTTCGKQKMTLEMLSDNTKPTKSQKVLLQKYWKDIGDVFDEKSLIIESGNDAKAKEYDAFYKSNIYPASLVLNADLLSGKIAWGTFNKEKIRLNTVNTNKFEEIKNK